MRSGAALGKYGAILGLAVGGLAFGLTGCARFDARPLAAPEAAHQFDARSLTNADLKSFLQSASAIRSWPPGAWDLDTLTWVGFFYQPDLAWARAHWRSAQAAEITARQRPNPSATVAAEYDAQIPDAPSPWVPFLSFDAPIETAGKRGYRMAEARHLSEAAHWNLAAAAWQVRSRVRFGLLNLYGADTLQALLARQEIAQSNVVQLLENQLAAGNVSAFEVTQARIARDSTELAQMDALRQRALARAQLAGALGLPTQALEGVSFSFAGLNLFPTKLTAPEVRRRALWSRADVRSALAEYASSQSALQLAIAGQYPNVNLGPGYSWNSGSAGDNAWELGLTLTLPALNQNQGPIAEARAKRQEAAAHFVAVQAQAVNEIDSALAAYEAARRQSAVAGALLRNLKQRLDSVRAMQRAGETDRLAVANAEVEYNAGELTWLDATLKAQQALGQLEAAMQSPLSLPEALRAKTAQYAPRQGR